MRLIKNFVKILISSFSVIITFYTVILFMQFLSDPVYYIDTVSNEQNQKSSNRDWWITTSWSLLKNMSLISLFIIQHSFMADIRVKNAFYSLHLTDIQRSIYVTFTSLSLLVLVNNWSPISDVYLWKMNLNSTPVWSFYLLLHVFAWIIIYVGCICLDVNELLGIKQIYYSIQSLPNPNSYKSMELQRFYAHIRHPSFISFIILFWCLPTMTLDRIQLATIVTLYMYLAWNPDELDYKYQETQHTRKSQRLTYMN